MKEVSEENCLRLICLSLFILFNSFIKILCRRFRPGCQERSKCKLLPWQKAKTIKILLEIGEEGENVRSGDFIAIKHWETQETHKTLALLVYFGRWREGGGDGRRNCLVHLSIVFFFIQITNMLVKHTFFLMEEGEKKVRCEKCGFPVNLYGYDCFQAICFNSD